MVRVRENDFYKNMENIAKGESTPKPEKAKPTAKPNTGSGVIPNDKDMDNFSSIKENSIKLLERQLSHEIRNYMIYMTFAGFYSEQCMPDLSKYFKLRAEEELEHSEWVHNFLEEAGCIFTYPSIEAVNEDIKDLLTPMLRTIEVEKETTEMIADLKKETSDDILLQQWLMDGPLVEEQLEEEEISIKLYRMAADDRVKWSEKEPQILETYLKHINE